MILSGEQLAGQLARNLAPIYLVAGDEPLQQMEAADAVRHRAKEGGYASREVFRVEKGFDWGELKAAASMRSLFAERRLIELRLSGSKPGDKGGKALRAWAETPPEDCILLILGGKLDPAVRRSKWFQALDKVGVVVQIWPVKPAELPAWIERRLLAKGQQASSEAVSLLAERVEGNLLAAAQEIEKLHMLYGERRLEVEEIATAVADSARFTVYELVDSALAGDEVRAVRILRGLRSEGVEAVIVLWALAREIRLLEQMAVELACGASLEQLLRRYRVWEQRKPVVRKGLQRHPFGRWQQLLRRAARIDRLIKGVEKGNPWDELLQLILLVAGRRIFHGDIRYIAEVSTGF